MLISGPKSGVRRQEISIKRLQLTDFKLDIHRGIHKEALTKAIDDFKLDDKVIGDIALKFINGLKERLAQKDIELEIDKSALDKIVEGGIALQAMLPADGCNLLEVVDGECIG